MTPLRVPLLPDWVRWGAVLAVAGSIFYVSIVTAPPETAVVVKPDLVPLDKWRHFLAYAALGSALIYATADWEMNSRRVALLVVGTTVLYGIGIEVWQSAIPGRYFSLGDAYANALGGVLALAWYPLGRDVEFTEA